MKITGTGVGKGHGPSIPIYPHISTFDELLNDKHTYIEGNEYVKYMIGFIVLNHISINSYCTGVDNKATPSTLKEISDRIKESYKLYKQSYKLNDISRIRRDANNYALQMRAQGY